MNKLVIFDYSTCDVHFYDVHKGTVVDEEFIEKLGYKSSECSWMIGKSIGVQFHKNMVG